MWFAGDLLGTATDATTLLNKIDGASQTNAEVQFPAGSFSISGATPGHLHQRTGACWGHGPDKSAKLAVAFNRRP